MPLNTGGEPMLLNPNNVKYLKRWRITNRTNVGGEPILLKPKNMEYLKCGRRTNRTNAGGESIDQTWAETAILLKPPNPTN